MKAVIKAFAKKNRKHVSVPALRGASPVHVNTYASGGKVLVEIRIEGQQINLYLEPNEDLADALEEASLQAVKAEKAFGRPLAFDEQVATNMMSRKLFIEKAGASHATSPSSETYWSS